MKFFNGFKAVLMASLVMPMALMSTSDEDKKRHFKNEHRRDMQRNVILGWSALAIGSLVINKVCEKQKLPLAACIFGGIGQIAALPGLILLADTVAPAMIGRPAEKLLDYTYNSTKAHNDSVNDQKNA
jgi:hypothetical protein